ncbi:MAG TPA: homoserine kinase [Anaeromyxobacteraceae bacterium]|nr:homoserine kinase [Anaeromyxobacteraceae bacterium]
MLARPVALYTPLTPEQLAAALARYGLPPPERALAEPKGSVNTNYHLWSGGRRWFLRLNEGKTVEDVAFEAEVLRFLARHAFPGAPLVLAQDGAAQVTVAGKPAMLFAYAPGEELERADVTAAHCAAIGAEVGRLHALAPEFPAARPNPYGRARVAAWVSELEPDGAGDALVAPSLPLLRRELQVAASLPGAPQGLVHGDLFLDNVLWVGGRVAALLDWEMSCVDALAWDLAVVVNAWCYGERFDPELARAFLAGYRSRCELSAATAAALYPYARYVALRYTASRIHAFHLADLPADRLAWKDWTRYRDRLAALSAMGEAGFAALVGL